MASPKCPRCGGDVCPNHDDDVGHTHPPDITEGWHCNACLKAPITAALDELAKTRPQRPA